MPSFTYARRWPSALKGNKSNLLLCSEDAKMQLNMNGCHPFHRLDNPLHRSPASQGKGSEFNCRLTPEEPVCAGTSRCAGAKRSCMSSPRQRCIPLTRHASFLNHSAFICAVSLTSSHFLLYTPVPSSCIYIGRSRNHQLYLPQVGHLTLSQ